MTTLNSSCRANSSDGGCTSVTDSRGIKASDNPWMEKLSAPPQACILLDYQGSTSYLTPHFYWAP